MWPTLLALTLTATQANAFLRFPCAQHTITRSDPLVSPGRVSAHAHQVVGGNSFDFLMPSEMDLVNQSTCSTCAVKENKSNYWTPTLYFQSPKDGKFKQVAQKPELLTGNPHGGMAVYYFQVGNVTAFPKGFRMITGDPYLRSFDNNTADSRSFMMRCLDEDLLNGPDTFGMPVTKCKGGVRAQIVFPTCWDGKNADSPTHKEHVVFAIGATIGDSIGQGCPPTHPVKLPLLYLETTWDTTAFDAEWTEGDGKQPFIWSMGDPTGYGYHADYMMGWPEETLKAAMSQCLDTSGQISACSVLSERSEQEMNDCAIPNRVDEDLGGWLDKLPGCNPVYPGPERAPVTTDCDAPTTILSKSEVTFLTTTLPGWTPVGCASENPGEQLLTGPQSTIPQMTVEKCTDYCASQSQSYAGVKKNTCSCGSGTDTTKFSASYACNIVCDGNANEFCGAENRVAVYTSS